MNTGQMLLVVGAFVLLSTLTLNIKGILLNRDRVVEETQTATMAVSVCQNALDALETAPFDSLFTGDRADTLTTPIATFACSTHVGYVQAAAPDSQVAGPTALKRIYVSVSNAYMPNPVALQTVRGKF